VNKAADCPSVFFTYTQREGLNWVEFVSGFGPEMALRELKYRHGEFKLVHISEYKRF